MSRSSSCITIAHLASLVDGLHTFNKEVLLHDQLIECNGVPAGKV